jgi:hypothetical protein
MPPAGFKPAIPANQEPQTHALDRAVTGIGHLYLSIIFFSEGQAGEA